MEEKNKYICEKCNYKTNISSLWKVHLNTELHKTGVRKKRSDYKEPIKCTGCEYSTKNKMILKTHFLNNHCDIEQKKKEFKFFCVLCNYGSFYEDAINIHNNSVKHKYKVLLNKE